MVNELHKGINWKAWSAKKNNYPGKPIDSIFTLN